MVQVTDVEIVVGLGVVLIVVYVIGSYWKHRTLKRYAHWFEDRLSSTGRVQFASHGHAGLRVRCEVTDRSDGYRELHFAISLGARENLMHYALVSLMRDYDRIVFWGIVERPIRSNLRVMSASDKKQVEYSDNQANMRRLELQDIAGAGYVAYSSDRDYTMRVLSHASVATKLTGLKDIELIELDTTSSMIRVVSRLREQKLPSLTDFFLSFGRAV